MKRQKGGVYAVAWCEKKRKVCLLSTVNKVDDIQRPRPGKRGQPAQVYPKPLAIQQYTEHFNAVDKNDQCQSYYSVAAKVWKYIFWFIIDISLINAYALYCMWKFPVHTCLKLDLPGFLPVTWIITGVSVRNIGHLGFTSGLHGTSL